MSILDADGLSIEFTINLKSLLYVIGILIYTFLHEMIINAGGDCVDIFNIILIAKQVPTKGMIVSNGMKTL